MNISNAQITYQAAQQTYCCTGQWTTLQIHQVVDDFLQQTLPTDQKIIIDGQQVQQLDSAGALALTQCMEALQKRNNDVSLQHFSQQQHDLFALIQKNADTLHTPKPSVKHPGFLYFLGKESVQKLEQLDGLIILIGDLTEKLFGAFAHWRRFQGPSIISNIDHAGIKALPIIGLLSFLIGVVLAYQMGLQLETYGANIFIAYISGMAIFREFSPLITAIIIAGRTSSAFTAQIGSMKINEEIDAITTMGLSPTELLVVPKVLALIIVFPLLIFWSDVFSTFGAMIMSKFMLNVSYYDFLSRLKDSVGVRQLLLGLYKAPAFALLIALVGCFQGFRVVGSADSVGIQTTKSVVQALFLIILADAVYSVIYSWLNL